MPIFNQVLADFATFLAAFGCIFYFFFILVGFQLIWLLGVVQFWLVFDWLVMQFPTICCCFQPIVLLRLNHFWWIFDWFSGQFLTVG